jgi:hypothetical protein
MMGLLPELPIMVLSEFEKFEGDLSSNASISLAFVSTIQTNFEYLKTFIHFLEYVHCQHWVYKIIKLLDNNIGGNNGQKSGNKVYVEWPRPRSRKFKYNANHKKRKKSKISISGNIKWY